MTGGVTWRPARASSGSPAPVVQPRADASMATQVMALAPSHAQQQVQRHPAMLDDDLLVMLHSRLLPLHDDQNRPAAVLQHFTPILQ